MSPASRAAAEAVRRRARWGSRSRDSLGGNRGPSLFRVAYDAILYKDEGMRLLMVVWACSAALSAQVAQPDASAKLKQFEKNLENAMKGARAAASRKTPQWLAPPNRVCAISLLQVGAGFPRPDVWREIVCRILCPVQRSNRNRGCWRAFRARVAPDASRISR